jgi:putative ABC transport system ATP-binding protein
METVFEVKDVTKVFGEEEELKVTALDMIDLKIEKGEFSAIVGPSGSGKSTLLNIMSGLDNPTSGDVYLAGEDISNLTGNELSDFRRDHIGFIFQAYNLIPVLTAKENIEYVMLLQGKSKEERDRAVQEVLKDVGLEGYEDRYPRQLSGGQQQRVAVARAIVSKPNIVLADEPTANLDSKTGADLIELMHTLNRKYEITFIFSTHDPKIMDRAKRLITLVDGKVAKDEIRD